MPPARHRTAMRRQQLSRPLRLALAHGLLAGRTIFDFGCGRGDDLRVLTSLGFDADGWDPAHRPDTTHRPSDIVHLGYVLNVIDDPVERAATLRTAWTLTRHCLVIAARLEIERDDAHVAVHRDGWVTRHGTFQKFYEQDELRTWIEATLGTPATAAGPGVFYVFRRSPDRHRFATSRFSRPVRTFPAATAARRAERHHDALAPLVQFLAGRGRPPLADELDAEAASGIEQAFGSVRRATRVALLVCDPAVLLSAQAMRRADLLVVLALTTFAGRPRLADLDDSTQADIKSLWTSYRDACQRADQLLYAAGQTAAIELATRASTVGKLTRGALYVHRSASDRLPAVLRVYEGCAQVFIGTVEDANLIKLHRSEPAVSYLSYPDFDRDPHPALAESLHIDLRGLRARRHDYVRRTNPPILHRKEAFVADDYPRHATFARLTAREEAAGLLDDTTTIGTREGWEATLAAAGVALRGHRLIARSRD